MSLVVSRIVLALMALSPCVSCVLPHGMMSKEVFISGELDLGSAHEGLGVEISAVANFPLSAPRSAFGDPRLSAPVYVPLGRLEALDSFLVDLGQLPFPYSFSAPLAYLYLDFGDYGYFCVDTLRGEITEIRSPSAIHGDSLDAVIVKFLGASNLDQSGVEYSISIHYGTSDPAE